MSLSCPFHIIFLVAVSGMLLHSFLSKEFLCLQFTDLPFCGEFCTNKTEVAVLLFTLFIKLLSIESSLKS